MNLFSTGERRAPPRSYTPLHARSGAGGSKAAPSPLTFEEWLYLVPAVAPPPEAIPLLQQYRTVIDGYMPQFTAIIMRNPQKLKRKGFRIPARFLPEGEPDKAEVIAAAVRLYRQFLDERYAAR